MTDLISRSALKEELNKFKLSDDCMQHEWAIQAADDVAKYTIAAIKNAPAIDAVPVVHARWISEIVTKCDWKGSLKQYYQPCSCSACHEPAIREYNYCPNCGARMDAKEDD